MSKGKGIAGSDGAASSSEGGMFELHDHIIAERLHPLHVIQCPILRDGYAP